MSLKKDARTLQRYTGSSYSSNLRWAKTLREEGLVRAEKDAGTTDHDKALRVALHKRFPEVTIERDEP